MSLTTLSYGNGNPTVNCWVKRMVPQSIFDRKRDEGMSYASLEQRMARAYLAMLPDFVPEEHGSVSIAEQRAFYDLMKNLYQMIYDEPSRIVPSLHEDDAFPTRYKKGYGKPELEKNVLKIKKAIESLLKNMFLTGQGADVKFSKRQLKILSDIGIRDLNRLPEAWTWMANRPGADPVAFAYCLFDKNHVYSIDIYASLLGEGAFRRLEQWMLSQGYKPYDRYKTEWVDYQLTLAYANPAWGDACPNIGNEYKIKHTGISAQYDAYVSQPAALGLCIPYGLKFFLERFSEMGQQVRELVIERTKRCDGCRYCVQTDQTGRRPLACIPVVYEETVYRLCPYFPGYNYSWTCLDDALADRLIAFLAFMDGYVAEGSQAK